MPREQAETATPESSEGGASTAVAAPVKKPQAPRQKPKPLPPYRVLLHNDDVNTFEQVIAAIVQLTTLNPHEAILKTLEAHEAGLALLLTTHRERAELYVEQFMSMKITVTCEPSEG